MRIVCLLIAIGIACHGAGAEDSSPAKGIQIITPKDHLFHLELDQFNEIVQRDDLKDRNVVIVSIAGAFRQGKSFLLNFFIKYLNAQYKTHDVSDWLGEESGNSEISGFTWRGGRKRETVGIWMWSEIFTHDFENGEKVAIILLDTQGIFDDKSSVRDCTTIFALSMMLSSVQCYNVMQNIKEDDLQHLELFTEYGRLALEQSEIKPFQKLLFIVRDWPYAFENSYGAHGQKVIDEILSGNDDQTYEMKQLRKRIDSSFDEIGAFLMPFPGTIVAQGNQFTGDIKQIDPEFVKYVKVLAASLFAPKNLAIKKINGQNVRVKDLVSYVQSYLKTFNDDTLPEPKTVFMATAEASNMILLNDCVNLYVEAMQNVFANAESFFSETDLMKMHEKAKNEAIDQFQSKPKLGGDRFIASLMRKIDEEIQEKFNAFKLTNDEKQQHFSEKADLHNAKLISDIVDSYEKKIVNELENTFEEIKHSDLNNLCGKSKLAAIQQFDAMKMGDGDISLPFRQKLEQKLDEFQTAVIKMAELFNDCLNTYMTTMGGWLQKTDSFFDQNELIKTHQETKKAAVDKFAEQPKPGGNELAFKFQLKIEQFAEEKYRNFDIENKKKHEEFTTKANAHNENLVREIRADFENKILRGIENTYLNDDTFINLFIQSKMSALEDFGTRKMGAGDEASTYREKLERDLDGMQASLKQSNEKNRPKEEHHEDNGKGGGGWKREMWEDLGALLGGALKSYVGSRTGASDAAPDTSSDKANE